MAKRKIRFHHKRMPKRGHNLSALPQGRLLAAMEPGVWYGRPDMAALVAGDLGYDFVKRKVVYFRQLGWLEQAENPDWRPEDWVIKRGRVRRTKPRYVFRLTEEGEAERARAMMWL